MVHLRLSLSGRLTESEATVQKRLAWAEQQSSAAAKPGLFSCTIHDTSPDAAYDALKHAVAALSPFVRNKLQGLPADVLDYADLIASGSVEQAILKPVVIAGEMHVAPDFPCMPTGRTQTAGHVFTVLIAVMPFMLISQLIMPMLQCIAIISHLDGIRTFETCPCPHTIQRSYLGLRLAMWVCFLAICEAVCQQQTLPCLRSFFTREGAADPEAGRGVPADISSSSQACHSCLWARCSSTRATYCI